ncbi:MAG: DUF362 domain-containing protein [Candidatus Hydrothermarchaeales archaeon]
MSKVAVVKGKDREGNIVQTLELLKEDIKESIAKKGSGKLFIKINAIDPNFPLACTHPKALEIVLNNFQSDFDDIIVGDNTYAFYKEENLYRETVEKFKNARSSDLTEFPSGDIDFHQLEGKVKRGTISKITKTYYTISLALPKTHDYAIFTACTKNMMGCVINKRPSVHGVNIIERIFTNRYIKSLRPMNENLTNVIEHAMPDLCLLDAFTGMDGTGPLLGNKVNLGIAMGSLDGAALDATAARIVGFKKVHYLKMLAERGLGEIEPENIEIIKEGFIDLDEITKPFRPHYLYRYQVMLDGPTGIIPGFDYRLFLSYIKRFYRIKDKILEHLKKEELF